MLKQLARALPTWFVRWIGRAQFQYPFLAPLIRRGGSYITNGIGVISNGPARGLKINGTLGFPGYVLGTSEPEQQTWLLDNIAAGDVVFEVGANIGFFAILCARLVGKGGSVYAFEPHPGCAKACRQNLALNDFQNADVYEVAVSSSDGKLLLDISDSSTALARVSNSASLPINSCVEVRSTTLDTLVFERQLKAPKLIMIDVEGHEIEVLRGAQQTISKNLPTILCEVHWLGQGFIDYFTTHLEPLGYRLSNLEGGDIIRIYARWHAILQCN